MRLIIREEFVFQINLMHGKYQYCFKVDGKFKHDGNEPMKENVYGGKDNEIRFS